MATMESEDRGDDSVLDELARRESDGDDVAEMIALAGYLSAPPNEALVRLYPTLGDLSISIDIPSAEIAATRDAPTSTMPMGGTVVWVPRTTEVTLHRTRTVSTTAQQVTKFFGAADILEPNANRADRLNIRFSSAATHSKVPPVYVPPPCICDIASHCLPPCQCKI